jgi:hypothetical protein
VLFNQTLSQNSFGINHSVRQGGILSPVLFTAALLDDLIAELELSGIGCHVNYKYFGVIAYADDIVLLSATVDGLNSQLSICSRWSKQNQIEFNPAKSFVICFAEKSMKWPAEVPIPAFMDGNIICTASEVLHLGHILTNDLDDSNELIRVAKSFNKQFHAFHCRFGGIYNFQLLKQIFNSFCTSFYGLEGIDIHKVSGASVRFLRKSVNIALMKMLRLPRESVSPHLIAEGIMNADAVWRFRAVLFWKSLLKSCHPCKELLLISNLDTVLYSAHRSRLLPFSLPFLSRNCIHNTIILNWMMEKELV